MAKRLQVLLSSAEMKEIRQAAQREHLSVAEWVRGALRAALPGRLTQRAAVKLAAVREAARYSFPAPDIKQMLAEIESDANGKSPILRQQQ